MSKEILKKGQEVNGFIVEREVGKGGMSELYLARDRVLKRPVVIKVLKKEIFRIKGIEERFLREAQIQSNLDNPHIVQVLSIFYFESNLCLVMQYIEGVDLNRIIRKAESVRKEKGEKGALSSERAIHIFLQVLEGLGFMHKYGVIHGDIKPANILLDEQGRVRIVDFGLSFLASDDMDEQINKVQGGTPYFMSPEQMLNDNVDTRSDIYSLGVSLFQMITGKLPYIETQKISELLDLILEGNLDYPASVLKEFPKMASGTVRAILKALERYPEDRHQSCLEFLLALKESAPFEMYSEVLRLSLVTKGNLSKLERESLVKIAGQKGLAPESAFALERNIREELGLSISPVDEDEGQGSSFETVVREDDVKTRVDSKQFRKSTNHPE